MSEAIALRARQLKLLGMVLFLLGLITGMVVMNLKNPRMGLSAHLEGVLNGMFLVGVGLLWQELVLSARARSILFATLLYGTFANWVGTLLAAVWGTHEKTPLAGGNFGPEAWQETVVTGLLVTLALAMVVALSMLIWGLRGRGAQTA